LTFFEKYDIIYIGNEKGEKSMELWHEIYDLLHNMTGEEYHEITISEKCDVIMGSFTKEELAVALIELVKKGE
jgi:hypothetical protein